MRNLSACSRVQLGCRFSYLTPRMHLMAVRARSRGSGARLQDRPLDELAALDQPFTPQRLKVQGGVAALGDQPREPAKRGADQRRLLRQLR